MRGFSWYKQILGAVALALAGCEAPPPVDSYQISVAPEPVAAEGVATTAAADQSFRVSGVAGSAPSDAWVYVMNTRTTETVIVRPAADGSFVALISGRAGDKLQISVSRNSAGSAPVYVYLGGLNIKNPYSADGNWHVGQVHVHSINSDGINSPAQMEAAYFDAGYDFVISTDHRGTSPYFLDDDDGLTPDPDNSAAGKDLLWISGAEFGFGNVHMGAWGHGAGTPYFVPADLQGPIDYVRANGGITAINHPDNSDPGYAWEWYQDIKATKRYSVIEAFNGKPRDLETGGKAEVNHLPDAIDLADEFSQVWWIGADDCHDKDDSGQFNRYAVVVQTKNPGPTQNEILGALDSGNHYVREGASGPAIESIAVAGNDITVSLVDETSAYDVTWYKRGNEIVQQNQNVDRAATYRAKGDEGYVRAEVRRLSDGKRAFSQPLFVANNTDLAMTATASAGSGAANLTDNRSSTYWDAESGTGSFVVDAGSVRLVNAIKIDWYNVDDRRFDYRIEVSSTGAFAGEETEVVRETFNNRSALTLDFFDEVTRYIRVIITGQSVGAAGSIRVNEVRVFDSSPAPTQLYLDNVQGNDINTGLAGKPWLNFSYARERVRPRDVLNFVATGVPYSGGMQLYAIHSGEHADARIVFQGDPAALTEISASGANFGIQFEGARFVDWKYFDMHSAAIANAFTDAEVSNVTISNNRLHDSLRRGFLGSGKFRLVDNLVYGNAEDGAMVYVDGTEASLFSNVFSGNGQNGIVLDTTAAVTASVANNITAGNGVAAIVLGAGAMVTASHNCIDGSIIGPWSGAADIKGNPQFANAPGANFHLQATSPCIDAGLDLNLPGDFAGDPPLDVPSTPNTGSAGNYSRDYVDIGAFEFRP